MSTAHLDENARREFAERGVVRIEGLIAEAAVTANRNRVYEILEDASAWVDGRWAVAEKRNEGPNEGPNAERAPSKFDWIVPTKTLPMRRIRNCAKSRAFHAMFVPEAHAAARELGGSRLDPRPTHSSGGAQALTRPQLLFTPPGARYWFVPNAMWHVDVPRLGEAGPPGVQIFILLDDIPPGGGATLVVAGSHRLLNDRVRRSRDVSKSLKRMPYFQFLMGSRPQAEPSETTQANADSARLLHQPGHDGDVPLQVVELAGKAGDAYITDLRLLHTAAPNASNRPRLMATQRLPYPDIMDKLEDAYVKTRHRKGQPTTTDGSLQAQA